jgi:hypothetical protein
MGREKQAAEMATPSSQIDSSGRCHEIPDADPKFPAGRVADRHSLKPCPADLVTGIAADFRRAARVFWRFRTFCRVAPRRSNRSLHHSNEAAGRPVLWSQISSTTSQECDRFSSVVRHDPAQLSLMRMLTNGCCLPAAGFFFCGPRW